MNRFILSAIAGAGLLGATTAQAATQPVLSQHASQRSVVAGPDAANAHQSDLLGFGVLTALLAAAAVAAVIVVIVVVSDNNGASS